MAKLLPRLTVFIAIVLLVGACIADNSKKETTTQANWKRTQNEVITRLAGEPKSMNPSNAFDVNSLTCMRQTLQYLLFLDPDTYELTPQLAKARPSTAQLTEGPYAGGMAYTFELFDEAVWDNGTPVNASDFVFSLKAVLNPKLPTQRLSGYLKIMKDVQVDPDNPKKFTVFTEEAQVMAEEFISGAMPVIPEYIYDPEGLLSGFDLKDFLDDDRAVKIADDPKLQAHAEQFSSELHSRNPEGVIGSGAYKLVSWDSEGDLEFVKKENWWGDKVPGDLPMLQAYPDKLIFRPVLDMAAAATLLRDEAIDVCLMLDSKDFIAMRDDPKMTEDYEFHVVQGMLSYILYLNTKDPLLSDKRVRRALAHLVDVDVLIDKIFLGLADPVVGPIHPSRDYYDKALQPIGLDLEKATALLKEAGWEDSNGDGTVDKEVNGQRREFKLNMILNTTPASQQIGALVKENGAKVGIDVILDPKERSAWISSLSARDFQASTGGFASQPTAVDDLYQVWHTSSDTPEGFNRMGFGNAETDKLIEDIRVTFDKTKRDELYKRFQEIVYDEQPVVFLIAPQNRIVIHKRFDAKPTALSPGVYPSMFKLKELE
ncbi:MAG: hypothetical protein KDC44_03130 [Phaeodactylibacter sp.]|nr:hypothetical protein [Phaeodactylibacter sp.]